MAIISADVCPRLITELSLNLDCTLEASNATFKHEVLEFADIYGDIFINSQLNPKYSDNTYSYNRTDNSTKSIYNESDWWQNWFGDDDICIVPNLYCDTYISPFYCNRTEEEQWLRDFYHSTNGNHWINNTNWLQNDTDYCDWYGIECCSKIVNNYSTSAPFVTNFTYLPHKCINSIDFGSSGHRNNITGVLPSYWFNSTVFSKLKIENSGESDYHDGIIGKNLQGILPEYGEKLPNLMVLSLVKQSFNNSGYLPQFPIGKCMVSFDVRGSFYLNAMRIPEWNDQKYMNDLLLEDNYFIGTIPNWDNWVWPCRVDLGRNLAKHRNYSVDYCQHCHDSNKKFEHNMTNVINGSAIPEFNMNACPTMINFQVSSWNLNGTIGRLPSNTLCIPYAQQLWNIFNVGSQNMIDLSDNHLVGTVPFHYLTTPCMCNMIQ